jgi:hypothetical protein
MISTWPQEIFNIFLDGSGPVVYNVHVVYIVLLISSERMEESMADRKTIKISDETWLRLVKFRDSTPGWIASFDKAIQILLDRAEKKNGK